MSEQNGSNGRPGVENPLATAAARLNGREEHAAPAADVSPPSNGATAPAAAPTRFPWLILGIFVALLAYPHLVSYSMAGVGVQAAQFTVIAVSLVLLIGWVGQISLGHAALVGIGAYGTGWAVGGWGLNFPFATIVAGVLAGGAAAVLGSVALRVRGLYLAVATLIFTWMADAWLFRIPSVVKHEIISVPIIGNDDGVPRFDLGDRNTVFYLSWGVALLVLLVVAALRSSGTGRAWSAVRGSEVGAASLGIDVTRAKLSAFVVSGFLAGVAGSLIMLDRQSLSPEDFDPTMSLFFLAIAVVGGLSSLGGAVAASIFFAGLNEVFFRVSALGEALDLVSALLLAVMLLVYRGGLAAVPGSVQRLADRTRRTVDSRGSEGLRWFVDWLPRQLRAEWRQLQEWVGARGARIREASVPVTKRAEPLLVKVRPVLERLRVDGGDAVPAPLPVRSAAASAPEELPPDRSARRPLIEADAVTVRFGGLVAVNDASLAVREHEIVGLIGPNGAGKTTLFNAVAGLNRPTEGTVRLFGDDVTDLPVHERARRGVARTFQAIQLFPELDVFDNLLVATHVHAESGFFHHAMATERSLADELAARQRVAEVIEELELTDFADRLVADLPFGVLRVVELARAMVTGFPLLMLDEPASGLDNNETERFSNLLRRIRARGTTLLLIEHDVQMVTALCDYIYVLNRGEIISHGSAADIQADPIVRAAYLGTVGDESDEPGGAEPATERAAVAEVPS